MVNNPTITPITFSKSLNRQSIRPPHHSSHGQTHRTNLLVRNICLQTPLHIPSHGPSHPMEDASQHPDHSSCSHLFHPSTPDISPSNPHQRSQNRRSRVLLGRETRHSARAGCSYFSSPTARIAD